MTNFPQVYTEYESQFKKKRINYDFNHSKMFKYIPSVSSPVALLVSIIVSDGQDRLFNAHFPQVCLDISNRERILTSAVKQSFFKRLQLPE